MIILGSKYSVTEDEKKLLSNKVKDIHEVKIKNTKDEEILEEIKSYIENNDIEFVVLNLEDNLSLQIKGYLEELDYDGIKIILFSEFSLNFLDREIIEFNDNNISVYQNIHHNEFAKSLKRVFDFIFSLSVLILLTPIFIAIAIFIKIFSFNGPILFTQQRLGLNNTFFRVYKFRTMIINAEKVLEEMLQEDDKLKDEYLTFRKLKNDPRIIPKIGNFLRKTSLDELPQFFNVLIGNMSVVGPRPYIKEEFYNHDNKFLDIILSVKPGITGLWQVGSRNNTTFNDRVMQDIEYINKQSFWSDIKIIFQTIQVMVFKKGV